MELLRQQTSILYRQRTSSVSRWPSAPKSLLPRISEGLLSRTSGGRFRTDCRVWRWICQHREERSARPWVGATTTVSAGGRTVTSARRRSSSQKKERSSSLNVGLELEILAFMLQSGMSDSFPSRQELILAGRQDLVEAIVAEGGWLASGWGKQANGPAVGGGIQEVSRRPLSRQRALRDSSKAVRSPRRPRGRPILVERRSLPDSASPGENSEADEPENNHIMGKVDDQNIGSPRDGNGPEENAAVKLEGVEDGACSVSFQHVRKEWGSKFPTGSVGYKLWEFESLASIIDYRKFNARNGSRQRKQFGSNSSARDKRLNTDAAKRRRELCKKSCDATSELCRPSFQSGLEGKVRKESDTASNIEQDKKSDESVCPQAGSGTSSTSDQNRGRDEGVTSGAGVDPAATVEQDIGLDEAVSPEAVSESPAIIEEDRGLDETMISEGGMKAAEDPQASSVTATDVDPNLADERDPGMGKASSSDESVDEVRETLVEAEGKPKKKKKTRKKVKVEKSEDVCKTTEETLDWINQLVEQREKWILEGKASSAEGPPNIPQSVQDRIRSLEVTLCATRTALQSRRVALDPKENGQEQPSSSSDVHSRRLEELRNASDELEFTENKILKLSSELKTTRREVAALEGSRGIEIIDVRSAGGEVEKKIEDSKTNIRTLRTARIVWPHPAQEVFLIGSFSGWNEKIKMELCGAGVFIVSMPLPPGQYEIKFIVDGTWRVDTERPIVYVGGYENNVVTIPEHFTFNHRL